MDQETYGKYMANSMSVVTVIIPLGLFAPGALWIVIPVMIIVLSSIASVLGTKYVEKYGIETKKNNQKPYIVSDQDLFDSYHEELIENHKEIRAKLQKILNVSDKIRLDILKDALEMEEKVFNKMIFNWAEDFGFRIDGDYIKIGNADIERFISSLDEQFQNWNKQEKI